VAISEGGRAVKKPKKKKEKTEAPQPASKELMERRKNYLKQLQEKRAREKEELSRMLGKKSSSHRYPGGGFKKDTFSPGHSGNK
jgi:hypothetical protein